jgi:hypothetical protein
MIGRMSGVVWMTIGHLRQQTPECSQEIQIGSRVQVGCGKRAGRVGHKDDTDAAFSLRLLQMRFYCFRYVDYLIFFGCSDGDGFHLLSFATKF